MASTPIKLAFSSFDPEGGANKKPPIIFLHGATASKENWEDVPQTVANATKRKTYAIDARNHGDTEWRDDFTFDCNADDLLHFMDTIKAPKAILVGHSMGGITGIQTALKCPERIEKLVIEDMVVRKLSKPLLDMVVLYTSVLLKSLEAMPAGLDEESAKKFVMDFIIQSVPPEIRVLMKRKPTDHVYVMLKPTEDGRYTFKSNLLGLLEALKNRETIMTEPTGVCEAPTCFIHGKLSPFHVEQDAEHIKQHFPKAEFSCIEDATHNVHNDCPEEFTEVLVKFILKE